MSKTHTVSARFPQYCTWRIDLHHIKDPLFPFSGKSRKQIGFTKRTLERHNYFFKIEKITKQFIDLFVPLYQNHMKAIGGVAYDIRDKLLIRPPHTYPYYAISFYHKEALTGGLLFSDRSHYLSVAYKVFPHTLPMKLPISVSYVAETLLNTFALDRGYAHIVQGRDRNLYGINDAIGLASYKFRIGCYPFVSKTSQKIPPLESFEWNGKDDVYVLLWPEKGQQITNALLLSKEKDKEKLEATYPILFQNTPPGVQLYNS